jgi:hypothetical protein
MDSHACNSAQVPTGTGRSGKNSGAPFRKNMKTVAATIDGVGKGQTVMKTVQGE